MLYVTHAIDEAVTLGDRLFLLSGGTIEAEGQPLDVLARRPSTGGLPRWPSLRNVFPAVVKGHDPRDRLIDDPPGRRPGAGRFEAGTPRGRGPVGGSILSDEIVLARGPIGAISARNLIEGRVERVVRHGSDAEVLVRTGGVVWVSGVVASTIDALGLIEGAEVRMIVKARSCQILGVEPP